jgi:hypothetical protein
MALRPLLPHDDGVLNALRRRMSKSSYAFRGTDECAKTI